MSAGRIERLRELQYLCEHNDFSTGDQDEALRWAIATLDPAPVSHWHVQRHGEDDDVFSGDLVDALGYAADELDRMADHQQDMISALGDAGDYEGAYQAFKLVGTWNGLVENLRNMHKQHTVPLAQRAGLYAADDDVTRARLALAREHAIGMASTTGPHGFRMWECDLVECAPHHEDDTDQRCRTGGCLGDPDDGEGWDGFCGNCADKQEPGAQPV